MNVQENAQVKVGQFINKRTLFISVCMALTFSMVMSFVMAIVNVGFTDILLRVWLTRWPIGFLTALPLSLFLPRLFNGLADKLNL
ncbi:hypothetical protein Dhaf_1839 [Desulfitobacterium hafniense DCB-2]|uniref:DUF2798 domain-containing protein n=1 Tax=Desulfitobacterium hafniense (strain DSM 10664 / DCB-2) TaxID=272564 RepID=B8FQJ1_DESHD|nr:DUF2798 domain-containing protein [Desulfitobacterium hafniense]ACL19881.1 hypothetical protein Dhaf_1839 [Desulfitobacterium hafniense DCB-2]